mmetsp:Transcript_6445/g.18446  ORF Transcript_6445/g.18446 Transcript_6445/m.18446 type:complete len:185 (+) Transcript_6445:61-615(+)
MLHHHVAARSLLSLGSSRSKSSCGDMRQCSVALSIGGRFQSPWSLELTHKDTSGDSSTTASAMTTPRSTVCFSSTAPSSAASLIFEASRHHEPFDDDRIGIFSEAAADEGQRGEPDYEDLPFISESWSDLDVRPTAAGKAAGEWDPSIWDASTLCEAAACEPSTSAWRQGSRPSHPMCAVVDSW